MGTLNARYGFKEPRSRFVERPRNQLVDAFNKWLNDVEFKSHDSYSARFDYDKAVKAIGCFGEIPYTEANALLLGLDQRTNIPNIAGIFVSACYRKAPEDVIFFDAEIDFTVDYVGFSLLDKTLINTTKAGDFFGLGSYGIIVNNCGVKGGFGTAQGTIINRGSTGIYTGEKFVGVFLNFGEPKLDEIGYKSVSLLVDYTDKSILSDFRGIGIIPNGNITEKIKPCIFSNKEGGKVEPQPIEKVPGLREFLDELETMSAVTDAQSARKFAARYGKRGEKIKEEVEELLSGFKP